MKPVKICIVVAALSGLLAAQAALAGHARYEKARVIDVRPIYEVVRVPSRERECWTEEIETRRPRHDDGARTVVGAIIGGVVGHQIAKGSDRFERRAATAAGAIIGGAVGRDLAGRERGGWREERHCRVTERYREEERHAGYQVTYRYHGQTYTTELDHDPGRFLRVRVDVRPAE
ncbi:glycine zipper 2TM domain-containing protein [Ectothiorhodospiraceae bacterium WFHF3C12]|nr:glycine zipper 2TM domain-containing protein [Ectothiorhodospiraceae bacterium WFHF3C12]